jgi:hypothetical protein
MSVDVGYERYGLQTDVEYFEERMREEDCAFAIEEVAWTRDHTRSKEDRVERLVPDIRDSRFFLPAVCWHGNEKCEWTVESDRISFRPLKKTPAEWTRMEDTNEPYRIVKPIKRVDEEKQIYDLTEAFMQELSYFPFGTHDDLCDAASRIYDLEPVPPVIHDAADFEPEHFVDS